MQIKRIEAKNMTEALRQIKRELGPEAVILSAKDLTKENRLLGITRTCGVEVTAAVDTPDPPSAPLPTVPQQASLGSDPEDEPRVERRRLIHRIQDVVRIGTPKSEQAPSVAVSEPDPPRQIPSVLAERLQQSGLSGKWVNRVLRAASEAVGDAEMGDVESVAASLKQVGLAVRPIPQKTKQQLVAVLVGPSGVGKSTALAKLAAFYKYRMQQTVGLVSMDDIRLGGQGQVVIFSRILGMRLERVSFRVGLVDAVSRLQSCDVILIDTPGISPKDPERIQILSQHLATLKSVHTLLVLSAVTRQKDLESVADAFGTLPFHSAVITKLDETDQIGDLLPVLVKRCLPVAFLGAGSRVPMDFHEATYLRWAEHFVGDGMRQRKEPLPVPAAPVAQADAADVDPGYVANRSSDVFHRTDCRWIRFINEANIVRFDTYADAVDHRFKPCRYCNPRATASETTLSTSPVGQARFGSYR